MNPFGNKIIPSGIRWEIPVTFQISLTFFQKYQLKIYDLNKIQSKSEA
jgi:hypothetical protein